MACDSCGAKRGHLGGCPLADPSRKSRKVKDAGGTKGHKHNYITVRREVTTVKDRRKRYRITYYFQECAVPGCPQPDKIEVERVEL